MSVSARNVYAAATAAATRAPTSSTGNLGTLIAPAPAEKRVYATAGQLALESVVANVTSKRFRTESGAVTAGLNAAGGAAPGLTFNGRPVEIMDTGFSTLDKQTDQRIHQTIVAKPYAKHYEQAFDHGTTLWCHALEPMFDRPGVHTLADVPVLNYFNELAAARAYAYSSGALRGAAREHAARDLASHGKHLGFTDAHTFRATWNWVGNMSGALRNGGGGGSGAASGTSRDPQRVITVSTWDRSYAFDLFSDSAVVKRGEQLYFTVKPRDVSGHRALLDPNGMAVPGHGVGGPQHALQISGFSDTTRPPHDSSCGDVSSFAGAPAARPLDTDADYVAREHRCATEYKHVEWDDEADTFHVRDLVAQEGEQEALASVNDLVYDAYQTGDVYHIGVARDVIGRPVSAEKRAAAHRSQKIMRTLPLVEMYTGI